MTAVSGELNGNPKGNFNGFYTRLIVNGVTPQPQHNGDEKKGKENSENPINLPYKMRNFIEKFFIDKHSSLNLTAHVKAGSFTATVPLATLDHITNGSEGESFTRIVIHSAKDFPLFSLRRNNGSIVSVKFSLRASKSLSSAMAGSALSVVQNATKLVAPQSAVVTTLTQDSTQRIASAIDQAVAKLFSMTISEEHVWDDDINGWEINAEDSTNAENGIKVELWIPEEEGEWTDDANRSVGVWTVRFDAPRPSVFADIKICKGAIGRCQEDPAEARKAAYNSANPNEVLSFQLVREAQNIGTVASYLKKTDWFSAALTQFGGRVSSESVTQFCRNIKASITDIGLNGTDADIVVKAVKLGMPLPSFVVQEMGKLSDCKPDHETLRS